VQKSTNAPLELQKMSFYQFVEDYIRIFLDIMRVYYGLRNVETDEERAPMPEMETGAALSQQAEMFDFGMLEKLELNLNVNVGASAYWSEIMQVQTADNLFAKGIISDPVIYLESIPDAYIKNKQSIIDDIKAKMQAAQNVPSEIPTEPQADAQTQLLTQQLITGTPTV